jgi:signal transduction histidine kinase
MELDGDPHVLPEGVQLTVFRVAQEALTNTLKHAARPTHAHLALRCRPEAVELEVTDTGEDVADSIAERTDHAGRQTDGAASRTDRTGARDDDAGLQSTPSFGGRGLRGMRERAAAYGGKLDAGPRPDGGWRVHLQLQPEVKTAA